MITNEQLMALAKEAQHVTALFTVWSGNLDKEQQKSSQAIVYYIKWIDVANGAVQNLAPDISAEAKKQLMDDLTVLVVTPLQGMLVALQSIAKQRNITLPPQDTQPDETIAFKKWAVDYINSALSALKEKK